MGRIPRSIHGGIMNIDANTLEKIGVWLICIAIGSMANGVILCFMAMMMRDGV